MFIDNLFLPYTVAIVVLLITTLFFSYRQSFHTLRNISAVSLICLPVIYFFWFLFRHIEDIPFSDDYNLLDSFIRLTTATTSEDRIQALFEQVNQHRFAFERTVMYLLYLLSGTFSVKMHVITGNLALVGIISLLYQYFKNSRLPLYFFTPVPLLICSLLFYENATWSIAALQNTPIIFFAMLTAYWLGKPRYYGWALLAAIITTFISGNGIAIWIVGIIILFFREKYSRMLSWLLVAGVVISFYFFYDYHYYKSAGVSLLSYPLKNLLLVNAFWGNIFYGDFSHLDTRTLYPDVLAAVVAGFLLLILAIAFLLKTAFNHHYARRPANWMLVGTMLFLLATGCMLTISRPTDWNILHGGDVFSRRYMIFGTVFFVCGYLVFIDLIHHSKRLLKTTGFIVSILALITNVGTYCFFAPKVITTQTELALDSYYLKHHKTLLSIGETYGEKPFWNHPDTFTDLLKTASQLGLFKHPEPDLQDQILNLPTLGNKEFENLTLKTSKERIAKNLGGFGTKINLMLEYNPDSEESVQYFIFKSDQHTFFTPAVLSNKPVDQPSDFWKVFYSYAFRVEKFPAGTYEVKAVTIPKNTGAAEYKVRKLGKSIVLGGHQGL